VIPSETLHSATSLAKATNKRTPETLASTDVVRKATVKRSAEAATMTIALRRAVVKTPFVEASHATPSVTAVKWGYWSAAYVKTNESSAASDVADYLNSYVGADKLISVGIVQIASDNCGVLIVYKT
jgi:hypothetical protein